MTEILEPQAPAVPTLMKSAMIVCSQLANQLNTNPEARDELPEALQPHRTAVGTIFERLMTMEDLRVHVTFDEHHTIIASHAV